MKVQTNVKLTTLGRKDIPPKEDWYNIYKDFPLERLKKVGYSFNTGLKYEYGKTICIKNTCRRKAKQLGLNFKFSVRKHKDNIRVWRTQ